MVRRFAKYSGIFTLSIVAFVAIYAMMAFGLSRITVNNDVQPANEVDIYILTNGVHTDIVVPVNNIQIDWSEFIKYQNTIANNTSLQWLAFGWGNRKFYLETPTWADLKVSTAFEAAGGIGSSAMHTTFYSSLRESESCKKISISHNQYNQLITYLKNSFKLDDNHRPIVIPTNANYGNDDAFYEAEGSYSLFHTCNTWTNNALKAADQKASLWTPMDTGIFHHYK